MKKMLSLVLALMLCLSVVSFASAADDMSEEANLVFYVMGDAPKDEVAVEDAINAILKEKFNATLDFQFSTWTDFNLKYNNTLISSGADLIYVANWENYGLNANAGAFLEMDELLDAYAPELKELCGEGMLNMCRVNGDLYCIPAMWPEYVSLGIKYREDLRAKYDLPYPTTMENIEAYLKGIQAADPAQGLLRPTNTESASSLIIGFDTAYLLADKYPWVAPFGFPYGLAADYSTPSEVYDYWFSEDFVTDCKLFKSWADQGFWSKSALSDTNDSEAYDNGLAVAEVAGMNPNKQITSANNFAKNILNGKAPISSTAKTPALCIPAMPPRTAPPSCAEPSIPNAAR